MERKLAPDKTREHSRSWLGGIIGSVKSSLVSLLSRVGVFWSKQEKQKKEKERKDSSSNETKETTPDEKEKKADENGDVEWKVSQNWEGKEEIVQPAKESPKKKKWSRESVFWKGFFSRVRRFFVGTEERLNFKNYIENKWKQLSVWKKDYFWFINSRVTK